MMNRDRGAWSRIDAVDSLRGLSIVLVMMNHVNMRLLFAGVPYTRGLPHQLTSTLVWNGQYAVQMFFVLSGFLITATSIRRWGEPARLDVKAFYLLRFARIAPLLLLLLLVLSCLHWAQVPGYVVPVKTGGLGRALAAALTFHVGYLEATRGYLPGNWDVLWSLSVEEMFYLFFPIVGRVVRRRWALVLLLMLLIAAGPLARMEAFNHNEVWREYSYLGGMDGIAFGCLTAMFLSAGRLRRPTARGCAVAGFLLVVFSLCFSNQAERWGLGKTGISFTVLAVGVCLLLAAASEKAWRAPRLFAPLLLLGRRSYEVYLTHMFVVFALSSVFVAFGKPLAGVPFLFAETVLVAGLLGWLVAVLYAEPLNRYIRRRVGMVLSVVGAAMASDD